MSDDRGIEADRLRASFANIRQRVLDDPMLSDEGKLEKISTAREEANTKIRSLQEKATEERATERRRLERLLFAPPRPFSGTAASASDRIAQDASYRDALDRARRVPPESLLELLEQAERTSDSLQSRAVMVIAFERGAVDVLNAWTTANSSYERDVDLLWELRQRDEGPRGARLGEVLAEAFEYQSV